MINDTIEKAHRSSHLKRIRHATCKVDDKAPTMNSYSFYNERRVQESFMATIEHNTLNLQMMLTLSRIRLTHGAIDTNPPMVLTIKPLPLDRMVRNILELQRKNLGLGKRLMNIRQNSISPYKQPTYPRQGIDDNCMRQYATLARRRATRATRDTLKNSNRSSHDNKCRQIFEKYVGLNLQLPSNREELKRLLRPRIALHFGSLDGRLLGYIIIQLYTEAAPLLVLEFVHKCMNCNPQEFIVRRVFPTLWLEGYLSGCRESALSQAIEFDTRVVDNGHHAYVLSCAKDYCQQGFPGAVINFTISFKPLAVTNGHRVGFGRVVRGNKLFNGLQNYGSKNGKLRNSLLVTRCQLL